MSSWKLLSADASLQVVFTPWTHLISSKADTEATCAETADSRLYACGKRAQLCACFCVIYVRACLCFGVSLDLHVHACACLCALWPLFAYAYICVCACVNNKLTAAVKFLSEHHRGEADESWQGARVKGGGRGRWRWARGRGRRRLPATFGDWGFSRSVQKLAAAVEERRSLSRYCLDLGECNAQTLDEPFPVHKSRWCRRLAFSFCCSSSRLFMYLLHFGIKFHCSVQLKDP